MFPYVSMAEKRIEGIGSGGLTKDRPRTGHSRKIVPGLEALTNGWSIKPGPERSEGSPSGIILFLPFTIHYSPFTIHYSPFTIHYSPFTIHYSLLTIHYSLLTTTATAVRPSQENGRPTRSGRGRLPRDKALSIPWSEQ